MHFKNVQRVQCFVAREKIFFFKVGESGKKNEIKCMSMDCAIQPSLWRLVASSRVSFASHMEFPFIHSTSAANTIYFIFHPDCRKKKRHEKKKKIFIKKILLRKKKEVDLTWSSTKVGCLIGKFFFCRPFRLLNEFSYTSLRIYNKWWWLLLWIVYY